MVFKEQYVFGTGFEKMLIKKFIHCQDCCKAICIIYIGFERALILK